MKHLGALHNFRVLLLMDSLLRGRARERRARSCHGIGYLGWDGIRYPGKDGKVACQERSSQVARSSAYTEFNPSS